MRLFKDDFNKHSCLSSHGNHSKLGDYKINYYYSTSNGYKATCEITFTLKNNALNICFRMNYVQA